MLKPGIKCVLAPIWTTYDLRRFADNMIYHFDPKEVYGGEFPSKMFLALKEKEVKQFGEYRTRRLVLEAWDKLEKNSV